MNSVDTDTGEHSFAEPSQQQSRFWNEMVQLKAHIFYLGYHRRGADQIDFWIKCMTAVTSSASIAGWAIWQTYGFAWGLIIAVSQVINTTKQYLPYEARRKTCNDACKDLEGLFIRSESDWYYVAEGTLTNENIHKKLISLKKRKSQIVKKCISVLVLPRKPKYERLAELDATNYFQTLYFGGENDV